MKKYIVITSINQPTEAVKKFAKLKDYNLIIVGDKKSPANYLLDNCKFLSVEEQIRSKFTLAQKLPFNHYCRKMLGYLEAIQQNADVIIDADDDNIPYDDWSFPDFTGNYDSLENLGFVNIYQFFTNKKIWTRGFPISLINNDKNLQPFVQKTYCNVGIWQGLADEDPDVDAIYRLTNNATCFFEKREPIVCKKGALSPFNSQNTLIRKELFPLMYLPTTVTFRYTDILRSLIAQPIMWLYGYNLGFTSANVIQKRNPHNYYKDFLSEIPMYETTEKVVEIASDSISARDDIKTNLTKVYQALQKENIVQENELKNLESWLYDIDTLMG
ncbi:MAG TPA: STELLO glycosyltransferase family protein [Verrucomicrobiota bacterium]|nr:STELLO glycosyltransferase family protein [Verrucomicrobiota bacterium]